MKHATPTTLRKIPTLLAAIRRHKSLTERKPGIFYQKSSAFLHFHENPAGLFADLKTSHGWKRLAVSTRSQVKLLRKELTEVLSHKTKPAKSKS